MTRWRLRAPLRAPRAHGALAAAGDLQFPQGFALQFPSNLTGSDTSEPYVALEFADPQLDGLPIWGASGAGATVIRKVQIIQQTGYYALFWWGQGGTGTFDPTAGYWGGHPYPTTGDNSGTSHVWEVATAAGDFFNSAGSSDVGQGTAVTKGVTYIQAIVVTRANASSKTIRFYFDLPNVDSGHYVERTVTIADYGETDPPSPKVTIGDSPWYSHYQHERASCVLDAQKIFNEPLTDVDDVLAEAADFSQIVTSAGQSALWWAKNGFLTIDDLTCDFGTGRSFAWANANKGTLVARL
jgi:hypothetical protein